MLFCGLIVSAKRDQTMPVDIKYKAERIEIHVPESDAKDLKLLDHSDILFAILYGALFIWGLCFTLASI